MNVRVFHHVHLEKQISLIGLKLSDLKDDFKRYKETGILPSNFGRDAQYNHMDTMSIVKQEQIAHVHLDEPDNSWSIKSVQFNRTSDTHLVYCQGFYQENCYLLMALLSPNAHEQAWNRNIMHNLGKMAEKFRNKY